MDTTPQKHGDNEALILVVDDNVDFLNGVELTLKMEGYQVWTATNGQQGLNKLQSAFRGGAGEGVSMDRLPDLILADIMMPVMDGYIFYERVRANPYLNHIPFIFLTAKSSEFDVRLGKELGADDYLAKPFSPEDLLASVRGKLRRIEQQQELAAQFTGDPNKPVGVVVLVTLAVVIIIAFICLIFLFFPFL